MLTLPQLVGVDTNVALNFAKGIDDVCDAIATIFARLPKAELLLPPTVVEELAHAAEATSHSYVRVVACEAVDLS